MVSTPALHQGLELFRANWPHRFPDHDTYTRLMALYALGCEDLTDEEWLAACVAAVKSSSHMPTPADLNGRARPPAPPTPIRDPELDYRPVNEVGRGWRGETVRLLPPAAVRTAEERDAEWEDGKAALLTKWSAMDEAAKTNPVPGPGRAALNRLTRRRKPRPADYAERGIADMHLDSIAADLAEHRARAIEEGNAAWAQSLRRQANRRGR